MNTETMTALDDETGHDFDADLIPMAPFSPPSLSASQYKQLELLQHLSLYSELLILFSGEKGMGKTFIAQALIASREEPDQSLIVDADFSLNYLDILHQLAQHIDLPELDDVDALEQQIVHYSAQLHKEDQGSFLLIIDQADQLTNDVLLHLNQLALMQPNALHVMLLATPILEEVLVDLPEPHAPLHVMQVEALTDDESEIILLEQFPEKEWTAEQVDYMLQQSKGSPGKLMYIGQRLFEGLDSNKGEQVSFPVTHIAAMLLVAAVLLVSFLYKNNEPTSANVEEVKSVTPILAEEESNPSVVEAESSSVKVENEDIDFNFIEPVEVAAANDGDAPSRDARTTIPSPVTKPLAATAPTVSETIKPDENKTEVVFSKAEQLLIDTKSSAFVVQLFGSYSEKSAQTFIQENKAKAKQLLSYQTVHQGKPWFVVISGPFESREAAKRSVEKLPATLRKQQPWVRSIEPVQVLIKARQ